MLDLKFASNRIAKADRGNKCTINSYVNNTTNYESIPR